MLFGFNSFIFFNQFIDFTLYTPLEQFDEVVWLSQSIFENVSNYILYVYEMEFNMNQRYSNIYSENNSMASFFYVNGLTINSLLIIGAIIYLNNVVYNYGFSHFFLLIAIHVLAGSFITVWFNDFFFASEVINNLANDSWVLSNEVSNNDSFSTINYNINTQFDFAIAIDEIFVTLFLAFFLIGGAESEYEDDYVLATEGRLDLVEEIVAPLFVANLGKSFDENGALYLKVCAIFSFVFVSNLLGMIPYGDTATSSLLLTFWVALSVFASLVTLRIRKHGVNYFFSLFMPSGCPLPLIFLLVPIEFLSYSFRLVSLAVRLFANMRAGHTLMKVLIGFSYVRFTLGDIYAVFAFMPALVVFVLRFLEMAVAGLQAYIFTILTCIYIKDNYVAH